MTLGEFIEANNRLENYYGKEYTTEQRQIMYEELKNINLEKYKKIISKCLRACKYLPKIVDIVEASMNMTGEMEEKKKREIYQCSKCEGTGYVFYTIFKNDGENKMPYTFAARCNCNNSVYANSKVPSIEELGIQVSKRENQVKDLTRDIKQIKKEILNQVK